jgi:hypothetical protein
MDNTSFYPVNSCIYVSCKNRKGHWSAADVGYNSLHSYYHESFLVRFIIHTFLNVLCEGTTCVRLLQTEKVEYMCSILKMKMFHASLTYLV